eukprot:15289783-Alexandrium_andersonii.AAC.1
MAEPEDGGEGESSQGEARACCKDTAAVRQALAPYVRSSAEAEFMLYGSSMNLAKMDREQI